METNTTKTFQIQKLLITFAAWIEIYNIIILFNGFQKKTQKTPKQEIEKAIKLKNQYYAEKQ